MSYRTHLFQDVGSNTDYRRVLYTGKKSQLVIMAIPPGGEVGEEIHYHVEQTLFFHSGSGEGTMNGDVFPIAAGDVVVVTPGTRHNFRNTGNEPLRIATVYTPANHLDGRIHRTKAEADADTEDEAFGDKSEH